MNKFKLIFIFALLLIAGAVLSCSDKKQGTELSGAKARTAKELQADVTKLIGKWQRPDGGYLIDIRKTLDKGNLDAAYYNPREINVSRALFMQTKDALKVFVELNDKGYPGSTYTLSYDPKDDVLTGDYFHAGLKRVFKVNFFRKK